MSDGYFNKSSSVSQSIIEGNVDLDDDEKSIDILFDSSRR